MKNLEWTSKKMARIRQSQEQRQKLSPQQLLRMGLIQLNSLSLEQRIIKELEENPVLELEEIAADEYGSQEEDGDSDDGQESEFDWDELISNPEDYGLAKGQAPDGFQDRQPALGRGLWDIVSEKLDDINMIDRDKSIAKEIIGNTDESGYLTIEPVLISDRLDVSEESVNSVRMRIQMLDPPGICSVDLQDMILTQLRFYKADSLSIDIIDSYFDEFVNRRYEKLMTALGCTKESLQKSIELISSMNPTPGLAYSEPDRDYIIPDIHASKSESGEWVVSLNDTNIPSIRLNKDYVSMAQRYPDRDDVKIFLKSKIQSANWFIEALEGRNRTISRVMASIISLQNDYFNKDSRMLRPMILKDVADDIDMDISTISRVVNGKYVQLPWEVKELRSFFAEGIAMDDGTEIASSEVKMILNDIISNEDKKNPYKDEDLATILSEKGFKIARRTISKYREELNFPVSRLRKEI